MYDHNGGDEGISQEQKETLYGPSNSLFMAVIQVCGAVGLFWGFF